MHLFFVPGDAKHSKASFIITKKDEKNQKWSIKVASKIQKNGYVIEAKIPIEQSFFPDLKMKKGTVFGFDIAIDDADTGKRKSQIVWRGGKNNYQDAGSFGKLILKK